MAWKMNLKINNFNWIMENIINIFKKKIHDKGKVIKTEKTLQTDDKMSFNFNTKEKIIHYQKKDDINDVCSIIDLYIE